MKPAPYEEAIDWVARVIMSCDTQAQLDTALKILVNYFEMYVFKPKHRQYDRFMMLTGSPLYAILERRKMEIDLL